MNEIYQTTNESYFSSQNIGHISIRMILAVSKCSIYDAENPICLVFGGPQTLHIRIIFEEILRMFHFHAKSVCHIISKICDTFRIPNKGIGILSITQPYM